MKKPLHTFHLPGTRSLKQVVLIKSISSHLRLNQPVIPVAPAVNDVHPFIRGI